MAFLKLESRVTKCTDLKLCGVIWTGGKTDMYFWPTKAQAGVISLDFVANSLKPTGFEVVLVDVTYVGSTDVKGVRCTQYKEEKSDRIWANTRLSISHPEYSRHYADNNVYFTGDTSETAPISKALTVTDMLNIFIAAQDADCYDANARSFFGAVAAKISEGSK